MNDLSDQQLLREYADGRRDAAFAELVRRHVDLVYSAALRLVRDAHLAKDVTQGVFVALADNAGKLARHPVLSGWLHCTARNLAAKSIRSDVRRRVREQEAAAMNELLSAETEPSWEAIAPHLDAALGELNEADRDVLLLRYFEKKSAVEMAEILGISDEAAQKRVTRAVERLRELFAKQGVAIGAGGLVVVITANAVEAAPAGLAVTISTTTLAGSALSTSSAVAITKTIAMTTLQKAIIGATLVVAVGTGIFEAHEAAQLREQVQTLEQQQAPLTDQIQQLQREHDDATNRLAGLSAGNQRSNSDSNEMEILKLRGEVAQLKSTENDPMTVAAKTWLAKVNRLKQRVEDYPGAKIPEFQFLTDDDWLKAARNNLVTDNDYRRAYADLRSASENKFVGTLLKPALDSYSNDNGGKFPNELGQLQRYFGSSVDDAVLQRWEIVPASVVPNVGVGDTIVTEKAPVDDLLDSRLAVGSRGYGNTDWVNSETGDTLKPVYKAYGDANGGNWSKFDFPQLMPYATTTEQQAAVQKLIDQKALRN